MKLKIILNIVMCFLFFNTSAQNLHEFIFCNTGDIQLKDCANSNYGKFKAYANQVAGALGMTPVPHDIIAPDFDAAMFKRKIDEVRINSNDIVFLYINTHGVNELLRKDIFPLLLVPDQKKLVSASKIHLYLTARKPRSIVTIVESCNKITDVNPQTLFILRQGPPPPGVPKKKVYPALEKVNIQKIFARPINILICSGNKGSTTLATPLGSYFTTNFLNIFDQTIDLPTNNELVNFDKILDQAGNITYQQGNYTFYPIWGKVKANWISIIKQGPGEDELYEAGYDSGPDFDSFTDPPRKQSALKFAVEVNNLFPLHPKKVFHHQNFRVKLKILNLDMVNDKIDSVVYSLDHTMPRPEVTAKNSNVNFFYKFTVIYGYRIKAKIYHSSGLAEEIYGEISAPGKVEY